MFSRDCKKPSAELYWDTQFFLKLAYLTDIFSELNVLNKSLQKKANFYLERKDTRLH